MNDKKKVRYRLQQLRHLKMWQLIVLLILSLLLSATFLRLNNIGMVERRAAVFSADKQGNSEAVLNNLFALQRYSSSHMNAESGAIYLEEGYKREVERRVEAAKSTATVNQDAIKKADETCRVQFPGYSQAYVQCNASEQAKYQSSSSIESGVVFPNPELYRHEFASPMWSADFAGVSVIITLVIAAAIVLRLIGVLVLQLLLRRHFDSI